MAHRSIIALAFSVASISCLSAEDKERLLIIHADDAGMSHSVNVGTIEGLESGGVSSASIMVPCAWFPEFAEYAKNHPEYDYGIHLTLTSEWKHYKWGPVAPREKVPSLVDKQGYLWRGVGGVAANVRADEVEIELRAQIDRALEFGVPLTHLDTHMGAVLARPDLIRVYTSLGLEYDLPVLFVRSPSPAVAAAYPAILETAKELLPALDTQGLPVLDATAQFYGGEVFEQRKSLYYQTIRELQPGVTQLIIHCGVDNSELKAITSSHARRDADRKIFTSQETLDLLKEENVRLITWKQFHEQTKAAKKAAQ